MGSAPDLLAETERQLRALLEVRDAGASDVPLSSLARDVLHQLLRSIGTEDSAQPLAHTALNVDDEHEELHEGSADPCASSAAAWEMRLQQWQAVRQAHAERLRHPERVVRAHGRGEGGAGEHQELRWADGPLEARLDAAPLWGDPPCVVEGQRRYMQAARQVPTVQQPLYLGKPQRQPPPMQPPAGETRNGQPSSLSEEGAVASSILWPDLAPPVPSAEEAFPAVHAPEPHERVDAARRRGDGSAEDRSWAADRATLAQEASGSAAELERLWAGGSTLSSEPLPIANELLHVPCTLNSSSPSCHHQHTSMPTPHAASALSHCCVPTRLSLRPSSQPRHSIEQLDLSSFEYRSLRDSTTGDFRPALTSRVVMRAQRSATASRGTVGDGSVSL
uniref:Uncharacterized protein n=1 Tax=Calcidiscus leptoporus TaxID=127549 RepID=A0A7S0J7F4_9EUKA|mmetsp:Transcript_4324/g.9809  ORF Transcript_4324/g.9809 Transcript_4324/m.9809 type:complete len:392 (+) Transcript_4324:14-1189(+)